MEPIKESVIYVANLAVWEADEDSFSVAGRRFYCYNHGLKEKDLVRITIEKVPDVHPDHDNQT